MKEDIDYTVLLPEKPPEGMIEHYVKKGYLKAEGLIYSAEHIINPLTGLKEKMARLKCTACGGVEYAIYRAAGGCSNSYSSAPFGFYHPKTNEPIISYNDTICPICGAEVRAYYLNAFYNNENRIDYIYPLSVTKVSGDIAFLKWSIYKYINKDGKTIYKAEPCEGYIYSKRKCIKVTGYRWGWYGVKYKTCSWNQLKRCTDNLGKVSRDLIYDFDMKLFEGTALENSKFDKYLKSSKETYPVTYLRVYQKYKNLENLIMQGAGAYVSDCIYQRNRKHYSSQFASDIDGIKWTENSPSKMVGLNKTEFRIFAKDKWGFKDLEFYNSAKEKGVTPEMIKDCRQEGYYQVKKLFDCEFEDNIPRVLRYLKKQRIICGDNDISVQYLIDYWEMKEKIGESVKDLSVRYPQKIVNAHDEVMRQQRYEADEKLIKLFEDRYDELLKYSFNDSNLMIVPAQNEHEMYLEGALLHHCVHRYSKDHASGRTAIFFIRHCDEPERPYFTLELDEKTLEVRQNRGKCNCARTDEVKEFEEKWLEHIKIIKEKEKKNGKRNDKIRKSA